MSAGHSSSEGEDFRAYVADQLAHLRQTARQQQLALDEITPQLTQLKQHLGHTQEHVRLVEVYQQENFRNN